MVVRARSFWLALLGPGYVAFAALRGLGAPSPFISPAGTPLARYLPWAALVGSPVLLALGWRLTAPPSRGVDRIDPTARSAARAGITGLVMVLAALTGPAGPAFVALGNLGAAIASLSALVALARLTSLGGLVEAPASARRLDAAAFASLLWTVAVALPAMREVFPERAATLDPRALDLATTAASLGALGLALVYALRVRSARRLELGVADRASAAAQLAAAALTVGLLAAVTSVATPERIFPLTAAVASLGVCASAVATEATALARGLRVTLALGLVGLPPALGAVWLVQASQGRAAAAVLAACGLSALAGLAAPAIARRLAPEGSRWLAALGAATDAAMNPDPDAALEDALLALGEATKSGEQGGEPPALYRFGAEGVRLDVVTVDRAGYAHVGRGDLPEDLARLTDGEPERILRLEVARAAEVRRPELRPIAEWLEQQGYGAMAAVRDELGVVGLLGIPRGPRAAPMTLEEVRALRTLGDRLGAVLAVSASLARSREREVVARTSAEREAGEAARLGAAVDHGKGRMIALARMIARPALVASYSPAARSAIEHLERLGEAGRPIALLTAPGVDAVAWAAVAHLASPRKGGPFTVVEGSASAEHDLERWRDPDESPLGAARGGTLVVVDAHALPDDVQGYLAAALGAEAQLVAAIPGTVDSLVAAGQMNERLADLLGDRAVALPPLAARSEDLQALAVEHLGRLGIRLQSRPLGLEPKALAALLEYEWPGNDAELYATLLRAAILTQGEVIGVAELEKIGFETGRKTRAAGRTKRRAVG